jgi:EmrB/QacA subfamily drug resistance transporter
MASTIDRSANAPGDDADVGGPRRNGHPGREGRWWALAALALCVLAVGLDGTVLTVALPTLAGALHADESDLQWFTSGYLLVLAAAMLAGQLADRYGRKTVLLVSLGLFAAGSATCALAPEPGWFVAARVLLGLGGAGVIVSALAVLTALFDESERPRAVGVFSAANFLSLPLGPLLGGWMLAHAWWGWVFLINVPIALVGLLAGALLIPQSRTAATKSLDRIGVLVSAAGLVVLTYGLIEAGQRGWTDGVAVGCMIAGVVMLAYFVLSQRRLARTGKAPLVDPALFADRSYTWGVLLAAVSVLAMIGMLFALPQYFQGVLGVWAAGSGVRLIPLIIGIAAAAIPADRIAAALGRRIVVSAGFVTVAAGLAIGSGTTPHSSGWFIAGWTLLSGLGVGLAVATATSAALSALSDEQGGVGAAVLQAINKTGAPFGAAVLGSVLSAGYLAHLATSPVVAALPADAAATVRGGLFGAVEVASRTGSADLLQVARQGFTSGMGTALLVSAGVAVAGAVLAAVFMPAGRAGLAARPQGPGEGGGNDDTSDTGATAPRTA